MNVITKTITLGDGTYHYNRNSNWQASRWSRNGNKWTDYVISLQSAPAQDAVPGTAFMR